jgi:hypothetical protein
MYSNANSASKVDQLLVNASSARDSSSSAFSTPVKIDHRLKASRIPGLNMDGSADKRYKQSSKSVPSVLEEAIRRIDQPISPPSSRASSASYSAPSSSSAAQSSYSSSSYNDGLTASQSEHLVNMQARGRLQERQRFHQEVSEFDAVPRPPPFFVKNQRVHARHWGAAGGGIRYAGQVVRVERGRNQRARGSALREAGRNSTRHAHLLPWWQRGRQKHRQPIATASS